MELIKQALASFEGTLPNDSKTAVAIALRATADEMQGKDAA
ncbi:MAG: hypothetical protein V5B35_05920 [Candidatus Accumulibacter necessarius]|jgi:hypothetical protein